MTTLVIVSIVVLIFCVLWGAPPSPGTKPAPAGFKMPEGFHAYISCSTFGGTVGLWAKDVKPGAIDGFEIIDTTTQHNAKVHTGAFRQLWKLDPSSYNCAYDPDAVGTVMGQVNKPGTVTVFYPDGSTLCFYGGLSKFEPAELKEGEFPMAAATFGVTNTDPSDSTEQAPVFSGSGT